MVDASEQFDRVLLVIDFPVGRAIENRSQNGKEWGFLAAGAVLPCRRDQSVNEHHPHEQVVSGPQPTILHFGVGLLDAEKALNEIGFAGAQVALAGATTIALGAYVDRIVVRGVGPMFW